MLETDQRNSTEKKLISCAIYTRKSHEEGLEQEFNSLDAQREAAEAFNQAAIARQSPSVPCGPSHNWNTSPTRRPSSKNSSSKSPRASPMLTARLVRFDASLASYPTFGRREPDRSSSFERHPIA